MAGSEGEKAARSNGAERTRLMSMCLFDFSEANHMLAVENFSANSTATDSKMSQKFFSKKHQTHRHFGRKSLVTSNQTITRGPCGNERLAAQKWPFRGVTEAGTDFIIFILRLVLAARTQHINF